MSPPHVDLPLRLDGAAVRFSQHVSTFHNTRHRLFWSWLSGTTPSKSFPARAPNIGDATRARYEVRRVLSCSRSSLTEELRNIVGITFVFSRSVYLGEVENFSTREPRIFHVLPLGLACAHALLSFCVVRFAVSSSCSCYPIFLGPVATAL